MQSETVAQLKILLQPDDTASQVVQYWDNLKTQMQPKLDESLELRNFVFATDTSTTSNADLGEFAWKNNTHLPKLCEIRDNLIAIYKATWFPNDFWMKWENYSLSEETKEKKRVIEGYMRNKVRVSSFEETLGDKCSADYVDYGNAFVGADWRDDRIFGPDGELIKDGYQGPVPFRISPEDIVFNLTAASFKDSPKVIRAMKTAGDMALLAEQLQESDPEQASIIKDALHLRSHAGLYSRDDFNKAEAYSVDGFGNYRDYLESGYVEILEFRGTFYNPDTGEVKRDHKIQVMDRRVVLLEQPWDSQLRDGGLYHVAYRTRNDNLWGMGPLDNLVGMQYRIDHLQGAKDDNIDLHIHPTKVITGDPDEVQHGPDKEIRLSEGESIQFVSPDLTPMQLNNEVQYMIQLMEEFAGSPKQSRGFRTPGEKTLGEVSLLESNANRLFLEKAIKFEKELIEPCLNGMLEVGRRRFSGSETIQIWDDAFSTYVMLDITESDLQADGVLSPIGARHFGQRNQQLQNLLQIYNSPLGQKIDTHLSSESLAALVTDSLQLERFGLISPYSAIHEQAEAARVTQQAQRELQEEAQVDIEGDIEDRIDE